MTKNPAKGNVLEVSNPIKGNVEVIEAFKSPTRGIRQHKMGFAVKDGEIHIYKLDLSRGGWLDMGALGSGSDMIWEWNAVENSFNATAGTWATVNHTSVYIGEYLSNAPAGLNDRVGLGAFYIEEEAAYTIGGIFVVGTNSGHASVWLSGVDKGFMDLYAGSGNYNTAKTLNLGTLTTGWYEIEIRVDGKHGSSSDYYCRPHSLYIKKD